jgi:kynureninase
MKRASITRSDCEALDRQDPLAAVRAQFSLPDGVIYLDGNSLGPLPLATPGRLAKTLNEEWGKGLITSWNTAGWLSLPQQVGDKIARLIGAHHGEVVAADSTSINLYKTLSAALNIAADDPTRTAIVSERGNFPTDLYIAQSLCHDRSLSLRLIERDELEGALHDDVAVLMLTHVDYRTGAMHDMAAVCAQAHEAGILTIWDLAHSAGAVPVDLHAAGADFAVGCGYKYLNGGPGAPAFLWMNPRHADRIRQPLTGWWGHAAPFAFTSEYVPAAGVNGFQSGTPSILGLAALDCGLDTLLAAEPFGGMAALRRKSLALTSLFMALVQERLTGHGFEIVTPPIDQQLRGSQVSLTRAEGAWAIVQALIERGVIGDFRAGVGKPQHDILRFGFAPLYTSHADVWRAVDQLQQIMESGQWREARYAQRHAVT